MILEHFALLRSTVFQKEYWKKYLGVSPHLPHHSSRISRLPSPPLRNAGLPGWMMSRVEQGPTKYHVEFTCGSMIHSTTRLTSSLTHPSYKTIEGFFRGLASLTYCTKTEIYPKYVFEAPSGVFFVKFDCWCVRGARRVRRDYGDDQSTRPLTAALPPLPTLAYYVCARCLVWRWSWGTKGHRDCRQKWRRRL